MTTNNTSHQQMVYNIREALETAGLETPMRKMTEENIRANGGLYPTIEGSHSVIMQVLGLDLSDDSLQGTPKRIAKMYIDELMYGLDYDNFPKCTVFENKAKYDEMLAVSNITVQSMCEHHFLPFIGTATVAYIPGAYFLGLSKFNRVVDFFCRRPQVQERLTEQISLAFRTILNTEDVAVVIKADHYCTKLRGAKDNGTTISSKLSGKFRDVPELRSEFLTLTR